ncbi:efflux RND transporter periplasmic adaptor subunit [Candidatus Curtissbacteria bacterium]|nr:efflux RND transporter periplasmic adaptor subunit [Candidatus Curtissbacteria bacterium]
MDTKNQKGKNTNFFSKTKNQILSHKKIAVAAVVIILGGFALFANINTKAATPAYQTAKVEKGTIVSTVSASGQVLTANLMNVTTNATGTVKTVFVKDGDSVDVGTNILEIEPDASTKAQNTQAYASYLAAKNNLNAAQVNLYTTQSTMFTNWNTFMVLATNSTYQNGDGSPNETNRALPQFHIAQDNWLASEATYKNQQAVVSQAQVALSSTWLSYMQTSSIVTAPMKGTVNNITYVPGMVLASQQSSSSTSSTSSNNSAGQRVAVVRNEGNPIATFNASEADVYKIQPGQRATLTLDSIAGKTFTGRVMTIDRVGTVTSNVTSYPVIISLDTDNNQILPNMAISANIIIDTKDDVLLVPSAVVQKQGDVATVRVLNHGQVENKMVDTGLVSDTQTEIISGLSEGEEVVSGARTTTTGGTGTGSGTTSPFSGNLRFGGGGFGGGGR